MKTKNIRNKDLHWEGDKLYYREYFLTELIPHDVYENHYHLKFYWRNEKTPEFFNIVNAKENARIYSLQKLPQSRTEGSRMRLNEVGAGQVALADIIARTVPIPLSRPQMEEIIPGGELRELFPFPEMAEVNLQWPKVGLEYLLQPWYGLSAMLTEWKRFLNMNIYDFGNDYVELALMVTAAVGVGLLFMLVLTTVAKLSMWFYTRYVKNIWKD